MKKNIITLCAFIALASVPVMAGVWAPQSSGSGGGSCYVITFNTSSYGVRQLYGTGTVSGSTFTGRLRRTDVAYNDLLKLYNCGTSGDCAWNYAYIYGSYYVSVVSVSGLPITSAQAVACY